MTEQAPPITILIAEDDLGLSRLIQNRLRGVGLKTEVVTDGAAAIAWVSEHSGQVLLLLDYRLPDMTGQQVIQKLGEIGKQVPFVITTGFGDEKVAVELMKMGARDYLVKDIHFLPLLTGVVERTISQIKTESKLGEAEKALRDSQQLLKATFNSLRAGLFILNPNSEIIDCNLAACEMFGYARSEMLGRRVEFLYIDDHHVKQLQVALHQAVNRQGHLKDFKFRMKRKDGTIFPTDHDIFPLRSIEGEDIGWVSLVEDLTEKQRIEETLKTSQNLADIGTLTAGIAHEIRSPLQVITGISESLIRSIGRGECEMERVIRQLETINRNGWRIAGIMGSLLNFARSSDGEIEAEDINEIVNDTLLLIEHQLVTWSNITVNTDLAINPLPVLCDRNKITQVLINLLTNARDAMPSGGDISICTVSNSQTGVVTLCVSDNGPGIPQELHEKVFEPFFTTKTHGEGTGLGLSIVADIVRQHGATISLKSAPREGTVFTIEFPAAEETAH